MTSHAELSRDLALALGYAPESVQRHGDQVLVYRFTRLMQKLHDALPDEYPLADLKESWHLFDYRDPTVFPPLDDFRALGWNACLDALGVKP